MPRDKYRLLSDHPYIGPGLELQREPRTIVQQCPKDYSHQEWVGYDSGIENAVESLQRLGP